MSKVVETGLETPSVLPNTATPIAEKGQAKRFNAGRLFGAARELVIEHGGEEYRLRITHAGKLILTK